MEASSLQTEQCIKNIERLFKESYPGRGGRMTRSELLRFLTLVTRGAIADASLEQVVEHCQACEDSSGMLDIVEFLSWLFSHAKNSGEAGAWALSSPRPLLGTPRVGVGMMYLATPREEVPHIDQVKDISEPAFSGTIERFRELHKEDQDLLDTLLNKVKVCHACGKSCAYTLENCNSCGASLGSVPITHTDNVFMGFVYGISSGKFPYTISLRAQTPDVLCFDDPLSVSVCHLNAIPTSVYVPDWRFLFTNPVQGLALVNELFQVAASAALKQYWADGPFRKKFFGNQPMPESAEDLLETTLCGVNCPPSMFQLHLQFIHAPLLPFHYCLALGDGHFHHGRFFPLEYVRAALALGEKVRMKITDSTPIEDIINKVSEHGVHYDSMHSALMRKCKCVQQRFSPWEEVDFMHQVVNGKVFSLFGGINAAPHKDAKGLQQEDTKALQNYGRPYDDNARPTGTYYRYAKTPGQVKHFAVSS
mmetsp:Transcript_95671/g.221833  ORF Transcript_95671/g.221833 Transcript_95671/m.221833 type:complete len:478 (+) Transcript_95671:204-1637(+)